ncbi:MAG: hypothetical protein ACI9T9_001271, partial [Oleiphilaceae bacterium]
MALTKLTSINKSVAKKLLVPIDSALAKNKTDIGTNTENIGTNTRNITKNTRDIAAIEALDVNQQGRLTSNETAIASLIEGQIGGIIVFETYPLLTANTPDTEAKEQASYKVTNDTVDPSRNGSYSWVTGTTYRKDAELVESVIDP